MADQLDITIVIPCADDMRLERCLNSIDEEVDVIVALNGATSEMKELVEKIGVNSCSIPHRNLPAACNAGINAATTNSILLMNSDCVFNPGAIRLLHDALGDAMVARGQVVFESTTWGNHILAQSHGAHYIDVRKAYQPALAFRKQVIDYVGYFFDEDIHWTEDADFSRRLHLSGLIPEYVSDCLVYHPPYTLRQSLKSVYHYGIGRRIAEEKSLIGTSKHYRPWSRATWQRSRLAIDHFDLATAIYLSTFWEGAYLLGYLTQVVGDVYGVRRALRTHLIS